MSAPAPMIEHFNSAPGLKEARGAWGIAVDTLRVRRRLVAEVAGAATISAAYMSEDGTLNLYLTTRHGFHATFMERPDVKTAVAAAMVERLGIPVRIAGVTWRP